MEPLLSRLCGQGTSPIQSRDSCMMEVNSAILQDENVEVECGDKRCYRMMQSCDQDLGRVESVAFPTISGVKISKIQLSRNPRSWILVLQKHIQPTDPSWQNSVHFADTAPTSCEGRESGGGSREGKWCEV